MWSVPLRAKTDSQKIYNSIQHINLPEKQKCLELYKVAKWRGPPGGWLCDHSQLTQADGSGMRGHWRSCWPQASASPTWSHRHHTCPQPGKTTFYQKDILPVTHLCYQASIENIQRLKDLMSMVVAEGTVH